MTTPETTNTPIISAEATNTDTPGHERSCGSCTLCCKLMGVPELKKRPTKWCKDCAQGQGCTVYETRPPSCRNFKCFWLLDDNFPEEMRPDLIHAIMASNDSPDSCVIHIDPDFPGTMSSEPVDALMNALLKVYPRVFVQCGRESALIQN